VAISNSYGAFVAVSSSQVQTNSSGQATVTLRAIHSGNLNGVPVSLRITAGGVSSAFNLTVYPSLYTWTITENVEYYTDDEGHYLPISTTQPETAADLGTAESKLDTTFKNYLDANGYDWFGLPTYTYSAPQAAN
jgi:hypothetical protein